MESDIITPLDTNHAFRGEYAFLSNMHPCQVDFLGRSYPSSENAYQAQKTLNEELRHYFTLISPTQAKKKAKDPSFLVIRDEWDKIRRLAMLEVVSAKFNQNPELKAKLLATGDMELVEYNYWNDRYFGVCRGEGENWLGRILMYVRKELRHQKK
jgi:ribA/ribD-fused uncharacterized protein